MENKYANRPDLFFKHQLQSNFKNETFNKISISNIISSNITEFYTSFNRKKFKVVNELLKIIYLLFIRDLYVYAKFHFKTSQVPLLKNKIIIEAISDEIRLRGFWLPVAREYKKDNLYILTEDLKLYNKYKTDFNIIIPYSFNFLLWIKSRFYIISKIIKFYNLIKTKENNTNFIALKLRVLGDVICQINSIVKSDELTKSYNPTSFLTIWDLHPLGAVYCSVFKKYNIPSITFIHGAIGVNSLIEFIPLIADYIISWGKHNTSLLKLNGIKPNKILECGCTRMTEYLDPNIDQIKIDKLNLKIDLEKKSYLFFEYRNYSKKVD